MTFPGIPDAWVAANFPSGLGFDPDDDPARDGITNSLKYQLGLDPHTYYITGLVNPGFNEEITDAPTLSFREEYPSDLYEQDSVEGWQADIGGHIEIWDEDDGNPYVELQSDMQAHGVKQEFDMLPESRVNFILRYKGRYEYEAYDNAFKLEVEGAEEMLVNGSPAPDSGGTRSHVFMDDDAWDPGMENGVWQENQKYGEWHYASVSITAPPGTSGLKQLTLSLVPQTTTSGTEDITYGGFVDILPVKVREAETESGFDYFLRFDSSKTPTHPWFMVPGGGVHNNRFVLAGLGESELDLDGTVPAVQITPEQTGQEDPLTVSVAGNLSGDGEGVELDDLTRLVNLAFYPKLIVNVKFFEVTLIRADETKLTPLNGSYRTGVKLRNHLNRVYGKQCNVFFNVSDDVTKIEVAYDVGDPDERFKEYERYPSGDLGLRNPGNDSLDCVLDSVDGLESTAEEDLVRSAGFDADAVANVYFLPRGASVANGPILENKLLETSLFSGIAFRSKKMILIPFAGNLNEAQIQHIVAHEIGHMPLIANSKGLDHPRNDGDPVPKGFPLKTLEMDMMRLMATEIAYTFLEGDPIEGRINPETNEPYAYLIKEEWDAIHGVNTP
jgi:hypothetical protein